MKKLILLFFLSALAPAAKAQTAEVTQLILNIEKLNQLRKILKELKAGYEILFNGYNTIKDLSEGNFKLHEAFLDGLLQVSPAVKNYARVKDIVQAQLAIIKEAGQARQRLLSSGQFSKDELDYAGKVYDQLSAASLKNLDALTTVVTAKKLRASDDERLRIIDKLYEEITDQLSFLRHFNGSASVLAAQRENELSDTKMLQELYELQP
ncbi:TerB family tellurite resistance protein [Dyadobacter subterraneus]|uniref:TerB family tellurite resistance protein n=1 Tax=Dyadobacter subterraneus TaxID=2773304 RepID=A0ABR9W9C5_9BACT|nr:TerB family tellurite resistance protein [Dyadobacter subterraneus]MBE9462071.1 TerB family tellurite resistance protein [Dyadobacter subterraneus]